MPSTDASRETSSCFVIMPFGGTWDQYYAQIYEPAIREAGLVPVRADDVFRAGSILQDIVDLLSRASVVLADITESNRNVHYELGLAHALGRPTLLVAPREVPLFVDVGLERMLTYDKDDPFWGTELRAKIAQALQQTVRNPATAIPTAFMHIKPSRMETDEVVILLRRIEERLADMASRGDLARRLPASGLADKIHGLPAAEEEAERLLLRMSPAEAVDRLLSAGVPKAMAEAAIAVAARRSGRSDPGPPDQYRVTSTGPR